ncbi:phytanoyl-CoA dioxygenase family protein [Luteimonas gilva]|uniref:Phytanoyl-CoA dioxygenase family protein n=1 Tax=Luteimonas gilva TaxID=2572684 RepID=A0A4U5JQI0_9GAMM|nr:phytanoyl-CoA dioxygenase family protein [Luteimonas gilva]TKR30157.1 phytanoyl-CoA dioxygenase family protein [Luteimonas gilva]
MSIEREGWVRLPRFLAPAEVAKLQARAEAVALGPEHGACVRPHNRLLPLRWSDSAVAAAVMPAHRRERLARAVAASDLRWISGYVSVKPAFSGALPWHQDWWCWRHPVSTRRAPAQIVVACYLSATDAGNGALRIVPGSHRRRMPAHDRVRGLETDADLPEQITIAAEPGDAVAMDYRLLHATHANATDRSRNAILLNFAPHWSTLPSELRSHLIQHPALPQRRERAPAASHWLPTFSGRRRSLRLDREVPANYRAR